jgi:hypothetical protein
MLLIYDYVDSLAYHHNMLFYNDITLEYRCLDCNNIFYEYEFDKFDGYCPKLVNNFIITIQRFIRKRKLRKLLILYSYYLLEDYFHPKSIFMDYYSKHLDKINKNKQLIMILNNKLKIYNLN